MVKILDAQLASMVSDHFPKTVQMAQGINACSKFFRVVSAVFAAMVLIMDAISILSTG